MTKLVNQVERYSEWETGEKRQHRGENAWREEKGGKLKIYLKGKDSGFPPQKVTKHNHYQVF